MLFDDKQFKWDRLEDLLSNAAKQANLDLEKLLDQVIIFFSPRVDFCEMKLLKV